MVGGTIIDITHANGAVKLWVCSDEGEACVHVEDDRGIGLPHMGEIVWWQGGRVFFDRDRRSAKKLCPSHHPHSCRVGLPT